MHLQPASKRDNQLNPIADYVSGKVMVKHSAVLLPHNRHINTLLTERFYLPLPQRDVVDFLLIDTRKQDLTSHRCVVVRSSGFKYCIEDRFSEVVKVLFSVRDGENKPELQ